MAEDAKKAHLFGPGNKAAVGHKRVGKEFRAQLEKAAPECLKALMDIVQNSKSDKARIAAAVAIWDRCYGRPGQAVRIDHNTPIDPGAIMAALADQARGIIINQDDDGVQQLLITPSQQLPDSIPIQATEITNPPEDS